MGSAAPLPWPDDPDEDEDAAFTTSQPTEMVLAFYRDQIERANAILASTPLSARPIGRHNREGADEVGAHGERVEADSGLVPALDRALASGLPAVVDCVQDRHEGLPGDLTPPDEIAGGHA